MMKQCPLGNKSATTQFNKRHFHFEAFPLFSCIKILMIPHWNVMGCHEILQATLKYLLVHIFDIGSLKRITEKIKTCLYFQSELDQKISNSIARTLVAKTEFGFWASSSSRWMLSHKILCLKVMKLDIIMIVSLWDLAAILAALLLRCLSNFQSDWKSLNANLAASSLHKMLW